MYVDWTKNLKDKEEKERFENSLLGSKHLFSRMKDILDEYEKSLNRSETDLKSFDQPNWDYKQAYKNGYRACLYKIQELITVHQE